MSRERSDSDSVISLLLAPQETEEEEERLADSKPKH